METKSEKKVWRYTNWKDGIRFEGFGDNPLAARNDAMRKLKEIDPTDPRVSYLDNVVTATEAKQ